MDWLTTVLHLALAVGLHVAVGLLHGAEERAAVAPVHGDERVARRRVLVLLHLALDGGAAEALAAPLELLVHHRLGDAQARDGDALGGVVRVHGGVQPGAVGEHAVHAAVAGRRLLRVAGDAALGVAGEDERVVRRRALRGPPDVAARLAVALHGGERDHGARPLVAGGRAAGAAPAAEAAGGEHGLLGAPLARQGADLAGGDAALALGPLRRLGHAVGLAEDVVLPLVEPGGALGDVLLVVEVLGEPGVGDAEAEGDVGAQARREPLVARRARRWGCSRGRRTPS